MPVMLLDAGERVLFTNEPMRALLGGGALSLIFGRRVTA